MRVAALYDIHGNLPALEAVLRDVADAHPDVILVGGDVATGPMPAETLTRLRHLDVPARFVRGNADRLLVDALDGRPLDERLPPVARDLTVWAARQLGRADRDLLAGFELRVVVDVDGIGAVCFCHGSPRSDEEIITEATPAQRVRPMLDGVREHVVVCGHTHMQFDRVIDDVRVVNAGSVGMPFGEPGAYWALLGPDVQLRRTAYDLDAAAAVVRATEYPQADEFAERNVLRPPTAAEMLTRLERAASGA